MLKITSLNTLTRQYIIMSILLGIMYSTYYIGAIMITVYGLYPIILTQSISQLAIIQVTPLFHLYYVGFPLSFIIFGIFIIGLTKKYAVLSIPIFITTYFTSELIAEQSHILYTSPTYHFFYLICALTPFSIYIIRKYFLIKPSLIGLLIYTGILFVASAFPAAQFTFTSNIDQAIWQIALCYLFYKSLYLKGENQ